VNRIAHGSVARVMYLAPSVGADPAASDYIALFDYNVRRFVEGKGMARPSRRWRERFGVRMRGEVVFVRVSSIDWIAGAGNYVRLYTGNESHLLRESLQNLAAELDPAVFLRVHRSAIVNIERVKKLVPAPDGSLSIILQDGAAVPLGPTYRAALEEVLGEKF